MPAIFVSHSSKDPEISERVASWLGTLGYERVFLDFDKETGLGAGEQWEQRLYRLRPPRFFGPNCCLSVAHTSCAA